MWGGLMFVWDGMMASRALTEPPRQWLCFAPCDATTSTHSAQQAALPAAFLHPATHAVYVVQAGGTIAESFLDEGFILDKRVGVGQVGH